MNISGRWHGIIGRRRSRISRDSLLRVLPVSFHAVPGRNCEGEINAEIVETKHGRKSESVRDKRRQRE